MGDGFSEGDGEEEACGCAFAVDGGVDGAGVEPVFGVLGDVLRVCFLSIGI